VLYLKQIPLRSFYILFSFSFDIRVWFSFTKSLLFLYFSFPY